MTAVESSIVIGCTPEEAFDLSQDYGLRLKWDPFLADLKFLDGAQVASVGVRTWVRSKRGLEMVSEYVAMDRPRVAAIKMVQGPWFFRVFGGSWRFREASGSTADSPRTEVTMRYTFGLVGWLWPVGWMVRPVVRRVFLKDVRGRLEGLRRGVEELRLHERIASLGHGKKRSG